MSWIKRYLSYLYPIPDKKMESKFSGTIEINWNNGQRVIDTLHANYSYGSLQRLLKHGLKKFDKSVLSNCKDLLILGVAGGSVIKTLREDLDYQKNITGIEIDPHMIYWLKKEFCIDNNFNTNIIELDANYYVQNTTSTYDLIIIDIFIDTEMPEFLFSNIFIDKSFDLLSTKGSILFNTIYRTEEHKKRNQKYYDYISTKTDKITRLDQLDGFNEIFLITKQ